ncbi:hypothetical protein K2173_026955 [Erythroxylum novogranatense]|uniref:Peroxisomal membrane protein PEX14 n=1 Tax=Erythroxylum novogranatense TaxID=1862640 RepID=A0AAV8TY05_9ROSI|nr:hypothetical protein K2173_026955 [Erythroxylum novogranatense]
MATPTSPPPSSDDDKPQNPADEVVQPVEGSHQDAKPEPAKLNPASVFVNSEPMREDQIQNAIKFLSHPKVRGSPIVHRRSFLEKKGLTKEEINEAFRRVPDPPPSAPATSTSHEGMVQSTPNVQVPAAVQTVQPTSAATAGAASSVGILPRSRFHWYHAVFAVGLLAVSGAGTAVLIKNTIVPRLKSWIRKVVLEEEDDVVKKSIAKPSLAEEAAAAAKSAAAAAADVAKASQELLDSKNQEKRYFQEFMNHLDMQVQEMKSMTTAIRKLEGLGENHRSAFHVREDDYRTSTANTKQVYGNGKTEVDLRSVRSSSPPAAAEPSAAPHPKSYMEIMAMVQRGERPSNIREINDSPPNPNQQISIPRVAPRTKPWEVGQPQTISSQVVESQGGGENLNYKVQDNGVTYQLDGESTVPWWQKKSPRITEIDNEDEFKSSPYGQTRAQPIQRTWVPPQPPPVAIAEAAEAIRRPKPSVRREQLAEDQTASQPTDAIDELQRITKISESGGPVGVNGGGSIVKSEIEELQEHS